MLPNHPLDRWFPDRSPPSVCVEDAVAGRVGLAACPILVSELGRALARAVLRQVGDDMGQALVKAVLAWAGRLAGTNCAHVPRVVRAFVQRRRAGRHVQSTGAALGLPGGDALRPAPRPIAPVWDAVRR